MIRGPEQFLFTQCDPGSTAKIWMGSGKNKGNKEKKRKKECCASQRYLNYLKTDDAELDFPSTEPKLPPRPENITHGVLGRFPELVYFFQGLLT